MVAERREDKGNEQEPLQVTDMKTIEEKVHGKVITIPGWDEESINIRVRRPSLMGLVRAGKIPNELLSTAQMAVEGTEETFEPGTEEFEQMCDLLYLVAEQAVVEPDPEKIVPHLTDTQLIFVHHYVMQGVRGLANFRRQLGSDGEAGIDLPDVGTEAERGSTTG